MTGNSYGKIFKLTTFGESHGKYIGGILDGMPPKMPLRDEDIQIELNKRRPGFSKYTTSRKESDKIKILSGVFNGYTTGSSIGMIIKNNNIRSYDYENIKNLYRPGHADYTYEMKYGIRDYRGGGRSSARETAIRVAAGAIAKKYLKLNYNIKIRAYTSMIGNIKCKFKNWKFVNFKNFFCANIDKNKKIKKLINFLKNNNDSIGAKINLIIENPTKGLGDPVFDKLDASLSHAIMSINAVKAIEIGDGYKVVKQKGSYNRDQMNKRGFITNHSGGILGGISNGENILISVYLKPTSSISKICKTIDKNFDEHKISIHGRHDPCVGIRAVPIIESMSAITIMDHFLINKAQCK